MIYIYIYIYIIYIYNIYILYIHIFSQLLNPTEALRKKNHTVSINYEGKNSKQNSRQLNTKN